MTVATTRPRPAPPAVNPGDPAKAVLNVLEDLEKEKRRLEEVQLASLNILEDFAGEKVRFEETQRAMLNLLDDFAMEREKVETANRDLSTALDSLRRAKEAVDVANRELESFAYSVSHDLRAPLRSIAGFSRVLFEDCSHQLDADARDSLSRILAATDKMAQLIDDLLNLSRITRAEMRRGRVNLSLMAHKVADGFKKSDPEREAEFTIQNGLAAEGDEHLMNVVLDNLIGNSWKFTAQCRPARIEFGSLRKDGKVTYFVKDNGAGFDMAYVHKLFQPFQRLHASHEFPGTGIGLATVKRIIDRHGGRAWIEAESGKGTTVYFTL